MSDRFFTPDPLSPGEYVLTGAEAHHLASVRRFAPGDRLTLFNGDGHDYPAEVVSTDRKRALLNVLASVAVDRELPFPLVVGSALPKGDRGDFLIEKLTELGVTRFVPLVTTRCVVVPKETVVRKLGRAVIEASKQCGRNRLMSVSAPLTWEQFVRLADLPVCRHVLHTGPGLAMLAGSPEGSAVAVAVGPEGGFTQGEIETAIAAGWRLASLGPRVLRVETAAIAAVAILGEQVSSPAGRALTAPP
ncbi:MAG TPA: RsmE family RNA methyltransferase [Gemmataceae bacterium]|nr:RsmE family RNA methyltransferase [Gemmataceae bacterium]